LTCLCIDFTSGIYSIIYRDDESWVKNCDNVFSLNFIIGLLILLPLKPHTLPDVFAETDCNLTPDLGMQTVVQTMQVLVTFYCYFTMLFRGGKTSGF